MSPRAMGAVNFPGILVQTRATPVPSLYKLHVHRWAGGIEANLLTITLAQELAVSAGMVHELMVYTRRGAVDEHLPPRPPRDEWVSLYADHRRLTVALGDALPEVAGSGASVRSMLDDSRALSAWAEGDPAALREWIESIGRRRLMKWVRMGWRSGHRGYRRHLHELAGHLKGEVEPDDGTFDRLLRESPEVYFYFRVVLPCVCLHRRLPLMLLRHARRGNLAAIEQLVRVDDLARHDPAIVRWWSEQSPPVRQARRDLLDRWSGRIDHGQFGPGRVKVSIAAIITVLVETVGAYWCFRERQWKKGRITAAQVQALFDAVAKDRAKRKRMDIRDSDLGEMQPDSLRRMIEREKPLWRIVIGGGRKFRWV